MRIQALQDLRYDPLLPYARPLEGDPYRMVVGDFVSTEEGTGLVHLAPSFGADDFKAGRQHNLGSLTLVDRAGRLTEEVQDPEFPLAGYPVKEAFLNDEEKALLEVSRGKVREVMDVLVQRDGERV